MNDDSFDRSSLADALGPILESFLARLRRGERPSIHEYANRFPEHAEEIHKVFPPLAEMELAGVAGAASLGASAGVGDRAEAKPGASDREPVLPLKRLGDYRIIREIGRGGMGIVYEAEREALRSRVALKIIHPHLRHQTHYLPLLVREAQAAAGLHHTNIVTVFDYGQHDGIGYYAMQYIDGHSLDRVLKDVRRLKREADRARPGSDGAAAQRTRQSPPEDTELEAPSPDRGLRSVSVGLMTGDFRPVHRASTARLAAAMAGADAITQGMPMSGSGDIPSGPPVDSHGDHEHDPPSSSSLGPTPGSSWFGKSAIRYQREIARIGAQVADALDYAHKRNVIHRDIKPHNILLDGLGNAWITDFGLAILKEEDGQSTAQAFAGTLRYMAPERLHGESDGRDDIYALGATLYEFLALRPVFDAPVAERLIGKIEHEPSPPLRQVDRRVHPDLAAIIEKCLAKDAAGRYAKAADLRDELRRFIEGRPVKTRPVPVYNRLWRWCRREPWLAGANIFAAVATTALAIGSTIAWRYYYDYSQRLETAVKAKGESERQALTNLFDAHVERAHSVRFSRQVGQRFEALDALDSAANVGRALGFPSERFGRLRDEAIACMALPDLRPTGRVITQPPSVVGFTYDSTMSRYALRFRDGTISVRRFADDQEIVRFQAQGDRDIAIFQLSPDGRYLATRHEPSAAVTVWDVDRRVIAVNDPGHVWPGATFSPDSRRILLDRQGTLLEYDLATGRLIRTWPGRVERIAFRPDGAQIALTGAESNTLRVFEMESGRLVRAVPLRAQPDQVVWSPDGTTLATACTDSKIDLFVSATGARKATVDGLAASFHPAGTLLATSDWQRKPQLWDPVLGRSRLSFSGDFEGFSRDGRIAVSVDNTWTICQVDPALEYRTFAHVSSHRVDCRDPSVRHDGRILAVASIEGGVVLWDLARGTELAFLPIRDTWSLRFEASGDLLTSGSIGALRWPIELDADRGIFRIGPPRRLALPGSDCGISEDRSGQIVAQPNHDFAFIATPERTTPLGPLDDCRSVAVSPDGEWLATGTHIVSHDAQVWRIRDATKVAELSTDHGTGGIVFSPDGKWLMTQRPHCRLWETGTWREARQKIGGQGYCFSPDGRVLVVQDANRIIRLVETETGRTLARLESPDLYGVLTASFSPDGSRLVITTPDGPAVHVWDLRAIRKNLVRIGLDWDAPAYSDDDPADPSLPALPRLQVDLGPSPLAWHPEPEFCKSFISDLEAMLAREPDQRRIRAVLAHYCNEFAWGLAAAPASARDPRHALALAGRAVELAPRASIYLNTLGVVQYRAGKFAEAVDTLEKSLQAGKGQFAAFDLFFLATAHHRLGHREEARSCFDRAVRWLAEQKGLNEQYARELADFRAEAESVLAGPAGEMPEDVFDERIERKSLTPR